MQEKEKNDKAKKQKIKKYVFSFLRIAISVGLLYFLIRTQLPDLTQAADLLKTAIIWLVVLSFSMHFLGIYITVLRWQTLLKTQNIVCRQNFLLSSVLTGFFFNNFLPTSIGGDVYRIYDTSKIKNSSGAKAASIVLMERTLGILSAVLYLLLALAFGFTQIRGDSILLPLAGLFAIVILVVVIMLFPEKFKLDVLFRKIKFLHRFKDKLRQVYDTFRSFKQYKRALFITFTLSIALQFCVVLNYYFASLAFGIDLSLMSFIFIVQMVAIISMIPISIGGIGVRENTMVFIMVSLGASSEKSAIVSLILFLMLLAPGIVGGILYAMRPYLDRKSKAKACKLETEVIG
jgi:glycosyltransferase 2 family protein